MQFLVIQTDGIFGISPHVVRSSAIVAFCRGLGSQFGPSARDVEFMLIT